MYETWTITKSIERLLEATEMWFLRRCQRISWIQHISNVRVLKYAGVNKQLIKTLRFRQLSFLGHCVRKKGLEHFVLTGKLVGSKARGRRRISYLKSLNVGLSNVEILRLADDRKMWNKLINDVCS